MGRHFDALSEAEQTAVVAYVRAEYDKLWSLQPTRYVLKIIHADPTAWQRGMCELIAADPERVREIMAALTPGAASRSSK